MLPPEVAGMERTREAVSQATVELYLATGNTSPTVAAICRHARVSPRTFYRHFPTKDDAITPVFDAWVLALGQALRVGWEQSELTQWLLPVVARVATHAAEARPLMLILDASVGRRVYWARLTEATKPLLLHEFRRRSLRDPELAAELAVTAVRVAYAAWLRARGSVEELEAMLALATVASLAHWLKPHGTTADDRAGERRIASHDARPLAR